jgi:hypothetical protein
VNFTPSSTADASELLAVTGVAVDGQIEHGAQPLATGVTELDAADWALVPTAFAAATLNVYAVPFVSPVTTTVAAGGFPPTVVTLCAVVPMYGVTV